MYLEMLDEMIILLRASDNEHWAQWFLEARNLCAEGEVAKSYLKVLGAYGGMGSFNDIYWALPPPQHERLALLKDAVWAWAKENLAG